MSIYESDDRLVLALEQLEVARELLLSGSSAKARMALILLDGLADALLYRRLETLYHTSADPWYRDDMPRYPKKLRNEAKKNVEIRLDLARAVTYVDTFVGDDEPLVDEFDRTVLLIGHAYRNAAYHRDSHNAAVIGTVGRLLFAAVARLVIRCQSNSLAVGSRASRFERFGISVDGMTTMRDAAVALVVRLLAGFDVATEELAAELAEDLEYRADEVENLLGYLRESGHDLGELIATAEFGDKHAADEELLRLSDLMDPSRRAKELGLSAINDDLMREAQEAVRKYRARVNELERTAPAETKVAQLADVRAAQAELADGGDVAAVLGNYYEADVVLTRLERYVGDAVSAYDDYIQQEIDRARGN